MAKEAALWVVIIRITLPISKGIYAEVSKTSSMFYALVMNTVKLCIRQKKQMLPFSGVVNHMPLSERKGTTPCEQETHSTLILTSAYPLLHTCGAISCPTTNLCLDCFRRREKNPETTVTCWLKLSARHWSNPSRYWSLCSTSEQLIPQTDARSWVSKSSLCQQSRRDSFNFETQNIDSNPAQAFSAVIGQLFLLVSVSFHFSKELNYIQIYIWLFLKKHIGFALNSFCCCCSSKQDNASSSHGHRADLLNDGSDCVVSLMFDLSPRKQIRIAK